MPDPRSDAEAQEARGKADVVIVLTCRNEAAMIEVNLRRLRTELTLVRRSFHYLIVDDGSSDDSFERLRALASADVQVIGHTPNRGRGFSVSRGLRAADAPIVGFLDPDLEIPTMAIAPCLQALDAGADLATVIRIYKFRFLDPIRYVLTVGYKWLVEALFGTGELDTEAGLKFFRRDAARTLLDEVENERWFWDTEIIVRALRRRMKIASIPVAFIRDPTHVSTVRLVRDTLDYFKAAIRLWRKLRAVTPDPSGR